MFCTDFIVSLIAWKEVEIGLVRFIIDYNHQ